MGDAAAQEIARHRRTIRASGGKIRRPIADIGHLAGRLTEARRIGHGAHEIDHVPARRLVEHGVEWRHHVADAVGDPPVEVAIGVIVDMVGGEVGGLHAEEPARRTVAAALTPVAGRAMGCEQVCTLHDRSRRVPRRGHMEARRISLDRRKLKRGYEIGDAGDDNGAARRDRARPQPCAPARRCADKDQQPAQEDTAAARPQRRHELASQLRVAESGIAVAHRERPGRLHMRARRRRAERADHADDRKAQCRLDQAIAYERGQRFGSGRYTASSSLAHEPRRDAEPIDGSDRNHGKEERDLDQQKPTVVGADQGRHAADQHPAVDEAGYQQRADAGDAHRRKPQRGVARRRE